MEYPNIGWAMAKRGCRNYEVADAAGLSESQFSRSLRGRRELSPVEKQRIASFLGFEADVLFARFSPAPIQLGESPGLATAAVFCSEKRSQ